MPFRIPYPVGKKILSRGAPRIMMPHLVTPRHHPGQRTSSIDELDSAPSAYTTGAVVFDGTNDYMGANMSADIADGKPGCLSYWVQYNGKDATTQVTCGSDIGTNADVSDKQTDNKIHVTLKQPGGSSAVSLVTTSTYTVASSAWLHVLASWDPATTTGHLYINDVQEEGTVTVSNVTIDYSQTLIRVGSNDTAATHLHADLADFYLNFTTYLDFSVVANRRLFIDAAGKPVDLGTDGSTPTGSAPLCWFRIIPGDAATTFATNKSGNTNHAITGTLVLAATSPTD